MIEFWNHIHKLQTTFIPAVLLHVVSDYIRKTVFIFLLQKASLEQYNLPVDEGWCPDFGPLANAWLLSTVGQGTSRENLLGYRILSASLPKQNVTSEEDSLAVWRREGLPMAFCWPGFPQLYHLAQTTQ